MKKFFISLLVIFMLVFNAYSQNTTGWQVGIDEDYYFVTSRAYKNDEVSASFFVETEKVVGSITEVGLAIHEYKDPDDFFTRDMFYNGTLLLDKTMYNVKFKALNLGVSYLAVFWIKDEAQTKLIVDKLKASKVATVSIKDNKGKVYTYIFNVENFSDFFKDRWIIF